MPHASKFNLVGSTEVLPTPVGRTAACYVRSTKHAFSILGTFIFKDSSVVDLNARTESSCTLNGDLGTKP